MVNDCFSFFSTINITIFYHKNNGYLAYFQQDNRSFVYIPPTQSPRTRRDFPGIIKKKGDP